MVVSDASKMKLDFLNFFRYKVDYTDSISSNLSKGKGYKTEVQLILLV